MQFWISALKTWCSDVENLKTLWFGNHQRSHRVHRFNHDLVNTCLETRTDIIETHTQWHSNLCSTCHLEHAVNTIVMCSYCHWNTILLGQFWTLTHTVANQGRLVKIVDMNYEVNIVYLQCPALTLRKNNWLVWELVKVLLR